MHVRRIARIDIVLSMSLDVLLQILGTLKCLATKVALVGLQGNVDTDMRGDVIALDRSGAARPPSTGEAKVVG